MKGGGAGSLGFFFPKRPWRHCSIYCIETGGFWSKKSPRLSLWTVSKELHLLFLSPHLICQYSALPLTIRASRCTKHMFVANKTMLPVIHIILCSCVHMLTTVFILSILIFSREKVFPIFLLISITYSTQNSSYSAKLCQRKCINSWTFATLY